MTIKLRPYKGDEKKIEIDIAVRLPNGEIVRERRQSPVPSRSGAQRWAEAREREIIKDGAAKKEPTKPRAQTLAEFWPEFMIGHCEANKQKESGIESKRYHFRQYLDPVLGKLPLDQITNARIAELKRYMVRELGASPTHKSKAGKSAATINNCLSSLSICLKVAVEWEKIPAMPCKLGRLKKQGRVPGFYDFEAYERVVAAAAELGPVHHLIVLLGGDAGLRRGEIMALPSACADTKTKLVEVAWNITIGEEAHATKGMEARHVPMTSRLHAAIRAHRHLRGPLLLCHDDGARLTKRTVRTMLRDVQRAAGVPAATGEIHILRHTFCSHLAMRGAPVGSIQKLAGHKALATTLKYMHLAQGETVRAIALLEPRERGEATEKGVAAPKNPG